jgi:hypothetical protein
MRDAGAALLVLTLLSMVSVGIEVRRPFRRFRRVRRPQRWPAAPGRSPAAWVIERLERDAGPCQGDSPSNWPREAINRPAPRPARRR